MVDGTERWKPTSGGKPLGVDWNGTPWSRRRRGGGPITGRDAPRAGGRASVLLTAW